MTTLFSRLQQNIALTLSDRKRLLVLYVEVCAIVFAAFAVFPGGFDYWGYFHRLAQGCERCTYNPYFTEWFMLPLGMFGEWRVGYLASIILGMAAIWIVTRWLDGNPLVALFAPPMLWVFWLGQIDMIAAFGVGLAWHSLQKQRPVWVGLGLLMMATKPQLTIFALLLMMGWGGARTLIVPAAAALVSFVMYGPDWPLRWLTYTPQTVFEGDAWFYISPLWLLVSVVGLLWVRGRRRQLHYALAAACAGMPFLGAYSFFPLVLFRVRWWEALVAYVPFALMGLTYSQWWLGLLIAQPVLIMARLIWESRAEVRAAASSDPPLAVSSGAAA